MEATARRGWIIADLERHPVPYHAIGIAGRLMRIHPRVIEDGRTSVTRALTRQDWRAIVEAAGIAPDAVRLRRFFYRLAVTRQRV
jgi:hypothetical protein